MKTTINYKNVIIQLGGSDIASLVVAHPVKAEYLRFGADGGYRAYLVDDLSLIPDYYTEQITGTHWLKIYDDEGLAFKAECDEFKVFRAGDFGCIIWLDKLSKITLPLGAYTSLPEAWAKVRTEQEAVK